MLIPGLGLSKRSSRELFRVMPLYGPPALPDDNLPTVTQATFYCCIGQLSQGFYGTNEESVVKYKQVHASFKIIRNI